MDPLTAGLEVHQQLNTSKLFCECPSDIRDDKPDFTVQRILRATAGEGGATDIAAQHEQHKQKYYQYHGYHDTTCLVELDEEPVSQVNPAALRTALQVAKMLHMHLIDEIHVMRKTVVDGSNTSGFQRTMLIGLNGHITVGGKQIRIEQLCLEEDSAKIVERGKDADTYNLSRLGVPLLEITTGPDLHTPEQVKEVAAYLGMLLRSTEQVKRGLGTIRQDVNVSVPGGTRVEVKGAQDLDSLHLIVQNETLRQKALINLTKIIPRQEYALTDVSTALKTTKAGFIAKALQSGKAVGIRLSGWKEALETELEPGMRLGKELAGYAKAHGFGGLVHSAEDHSKYPFSAEELAAIRSQLHCSADDAWLFMVGEEQKLRRFFAAVLIPRLNELSVAVPKEVRKAEADGTTSYLRPMPGASRMYPETDVRTIIPDTAHIPDVELITDRAKRLEKQYKLSADLAQQLAREGLAGLFESWVAQYTKLTPTMIATLLVTKEKEIKTRHNISVDIAVLAPFVLEKLNSGELAFSSVEEVLVKFARKEPVDFAAYKPVDQGEVKLVIQQLIRDNPGASAGLLMGKVMRALNNKVDGKQVQELLKELMPRE
jgi:glutamyl-tRNA(Gln) amidotransferase subunit E